MPGENWMKSTGDVEAWVRIPRVSATPMFLGWCEYHPVNEANYFWNPVYTDRGGSRAAFDKEFQNGEEMVALDLNKFNDNVVDLIEAMPRPDLNNPGSRSRLDVGSLLIANGNYFELWLRNFFYGTVNATPDLGPGWYYYACSCAGVLTVKQGTKVLMKRVIVEAMNKPNPSFGFDLKSNTLAAFAPIAGLAAQP